MNHSKVNIKLLSATILVIFGVYGHGMCQNVTFYACNILKRMGLKNAKIAAGSAVVPSNAGVFVFDSLNELSKQNSILYDVFNDNMEYPINPGWHSWVECDDVIFDVNLEVVSRNSKSVSELSLPINQCYYTRNPEIERQILELLSLGYVSDEKIEEAIKFYNKLKNKSKKIFIEEGEININNKGEITSWIIHTENENIKPWKL